MIMPWGKHKGEDLEDVPSSYLRWLQENCEDDEIRHAAADEHRYREDRNAHIED